MDTTRKTKADEAALKAAAKKLRRSVLQSTVDELYAARRENDGKLPYGKMSAAIAMLRGAGVEVSKGTFRRLKPSSSIVPDYVQIKEDASIVSEIECTVPAETTETTTVNFTSAECPEKDSASNSTTASNTVATKKTAKEKKAACINKIAEIFFHKKANSQGPLPSGYLRSLIEEQKKKFGVYDDISFNTIRSRAKRGVLAPPACGVPSPLAAVEDALILFAVAMARVRQPITSTEGIAFVNSLLKREMYGLQQRLIDFKRNRRDNQNEPDEKLGKVGIGYWRGFMRRHGSKLVTKSGQRYSWDRISDWSRISYIQQMYDCIYDQLVTAGVAETLEKPIFYDRDGNIVEQSAADGEAANIRIIHPECLLFAEETGYYNTSQREDGTYLGGPKFLSASGTTVPSGTASCTSTPPEHKFTIFGLTAATGEPVLAVIIFQGNSSKITTNLGLGIDITVAPNMNLDGSIRLDDSNTGPGKIFPGGPTCSFKGKNIPCSVHASKGGGLNSDILVAILRKLDAKNLYPRGEGLPTPCLILNGHQSRLDPKFLSYVNDAGHKWAVMLGVPNAKCYWQVGDSDEQNVAFKTAWYQAIEELMAYKRDDFDLPMTICTEDIMPCFNKAWECSFGRVESNKRAISDRGWNPPNRKLLAHPDLKADVIPEIIS